MVSISQSQAMISNTASIHDVNFSPFEEREEDALFVLYYDCPFCDCLVPKSSVNFHVRSVHPIEARKSDLKQLMHRVFAVTDVTDQMVCGEIDRDDRELSLAVDDPETAYFVEETASCSTSNSNEAVEVDFAVDEGCDTVSEYTIPEELPSDAPNEQNHVEANAGHKRRKKKKKPLFLPERLPEIPEILSTVIKSASPNRDRLHIMADISNMDEMKQWIAEYSRRSGTDWIVKSRARNRTKHSLFYVIYACKFSSFRKTRPKSHNHNLDFDCPAGLVFNVHEYCCEITIRTLHSHEVLDYELSSKRPVAKDTVLQFDTYFATGMRPAAALKHHRAWLQIQPDYQVEMLNDTSVCPSNRQVWHLYEMYCRRSNQRRNHSF